jgi:hypothetical protein
MMLAALTTPYGEVSPSPQYSPLSTPYNMPY